MGTWAPARPLLPPTPGATPPPQAESGFLSVGEIDRKTKSLTHLLMDPDTERAAKKAIAGQVGEHEAERERLQEAFSNLAECANSHRPQVQRPILSVRSCRPPGGSSGRPLRPPGYEPDEQAASPTVVTRYVASTSVDSQGSRAFSPDFAPFRPVRAPPPDRCVGRMAGERPRGLPERQVAQHSRSSWPPHAERPPRVTTSRRTGRASSVLGFFDRRRADRSDGPLLSPYKFRPSSHAASRQ